MRKKSELIRQIYAMEKVPVIRANFVDLTETSGIGYLSEMSIVEVCVIVCKVAKCKPWFPCTDQHICTTIASRAIIINENCRGGKNEGKEGDN